MMKEMHHKKSISENGFLKGYLVDYRNGKRMGVEPNGSSRRHHIVTHQFKNEYYLYCCW